MLGASPNCHGSQRKLTLDFYDPSVHRHGSLVSSLCRHDSLVSVSLFKERLQLAYVVSHRSNDLIFKQLGARRADRSRTSIAVVLLS